MREPFGKNTALLHLPSARQITPRHSQTDGALKQGGEQMRPDGHYRDQARREVLATNQTNTSVSDTPGQTDGP